MNPQDPPHWQIVNTSGLILVTDYVETKCSRLHHNIKMDMQTFRLGIHHSREPDSPVEGGKKTFSNSWTLGSYQDGFLTLATYFSSFI